MPPATKQVRFPFDKLTESTLKPLLKKFEKHRCNVTSVNAPNKAKRESGFLIKFFELTFEDGQIMTVRIKADGTVFQVKLNKRVMPIKNVDDMDKAIIEMVDYVQDNAKAYERAKAQRERRKILPPKPSIVTSRREKIDKAKATLGELNATNLDLEKQAAEQAASTDAARAELDAAVKALEAEKARTIELEKQIAAFAA